MIEIDIPTIDPIQHEAKIFLGMTSRQSVCVVVGTLIGGSLFALTVGKNLETATVLLLIGLVPAFLMGWCKPYNMKFEDYVKLWIFNNFQQNSKRIYKTDGAEEIKFLTIEERLKQEEKTRQKELEDKKKNAKNKMKNQKSGV